MSWGFKKKTIGVCPVGCSVVAYNYFDFDMVEVAHGRAPAGGSHPLILSNGWKKR